MFCIDVNLCKKLKNAFNLKSSDIQRKLFSDLLEKLCQEAQILKNKTQENFCHNTKEIETIEQTVIQKTKELNEFKESSKLNEQALKEKFNMEISKYKEKVFFSLV